MNRITNIQYLRALAVISVLLYHIKAVNLKYFPSIEMGEYFSNGSGGVDLFFVISGFIISYIGREYKPSLNVALKFLIKRFVRIYPVYWFYSLVVLVIYLLYPSMVNSSQGGQVNIIDSFLLLPNDILPLLMVGWSLSYEVYFYFLFFVLILTLPWSIHRYFYFFYVIVILLNIYFSRINYTEGFLLNPFMIDFVLGTFCSNIYNDKINNSWRTSSFILPLVTVFFIVLLFYSFNYKLDDSNFIRIIYFGLPSFALVMMALFFKLKNDLFTKSYVLNFFEKIGDWSYSIYLSHILVINGIAIVFVRIFDMNSVINSILLVILMTVCSILAGALSYQILEQRMCNSIYAHFKKKISNEN
ncbi:TPA: acyltransferase family protein [Photobacterium damselae]